MVGFRRRPNVGFSRGMQSTNTITLLVVLADHFEGLGSLQLPLQRLHHRGSIIATDNINSKLFVLLMGVGNRRDDSAAGAGNVG
jgi:hypothetical protein